MEGGDDKMKHRKKRKSVFAKLDDMGIFYNATGQEISTAGVARPLQPIRGCLTVNSNTMLPGQQILMDEDKRLKVTAQLLLPQETIPYLPQPGRGSSGN